MRILVDLPEPSLKALDEVRRRRCVSRAQIIREAVGEYLERRPPPASARSGFGLWVDSGDGLEAQRALREEW